MIKCFYNGLIINPLFSQAAVTCLKLSIETVEQGVKYVQINNKNTRTTPASNLFLILFYCFYCYLWVDKCWLSLNLIRLIFLSTPWKHQKVFFMFSRVMKSKHWPEWVVNLQIDCYCRVTWEIFHENDLCNSWNIL